MKKGKSNKSIHYKALKRIRRFKLYTLSKNKYERRRSGIGKRGHRTRTAQLASNSHVETVKIPPTFSIGEDVNKVLSVIYTSKKLVEKERYDEIKFDFKETSVVDNGAITMLLALMNDINSNKVRVRANLPQLEPAKSFIVSSGFIQYFSGPHKLNTEEKLNTTLKKGKTTISQKETAKMIRKTSLVLYGEERRNQKLQGMLIELMTNSVNHAYINNHRQKTWYLANNIYKVDKKVEFCFVDNGDGIIQTIDMKFKERLASAFDKSEVIRKAFNGEYRSRTKLQNRGRGLMVVKNNFNADVIKGLVVISNDIMYNFENDSVTKLSTAFSGTFYSWRIE